MAYVEWENNKTPLNDINLNRMQDLIKEDIDNKTTLNIITGQEIATNEYIDGKQVYMKRISKLWNDDNVTLAIPCNISGNVLIDYIPIRFEAYLLGTSGNLFDINTPRPVGDKVDSTNVYGFWQSPTNEFICNHNGYTRRGSTAIVNLYYTKN